MTDIEIPAFSDSGIECPSCGDTYESYRGYSTHYNHCEGDKHPIVALIGTDRFKKLYDKYGSIKLGELLPCSRATITRVARDLGIGEKRGGDMGNSVAFNTRKRGHEYWQVYDSDGERHMVLVHRLLAVAEHGIDSVEDKVVHHKNEIPWDNRIENLEIMTAAEHTKLHKLD